MLRNLKVGFVFQNFNLLPPYERAAKRTDDAAQLYGGTPFAKEWPRPAPKRPCSWWDWATGWIHEPSAAFPCGQQQRVAIGPGRPQSTGRPFCSPMNQPETWIHGRARDVLQMFQKLNEEEGHHPSFSSPTTRTLLRHTQASHIRMKDGVICSRKARRKNMVRQNIKWPKTVKANGTPASSPVTKPARDITKPAGESLRTGFTQCAAPQRHAVASNLSWISIIGTLLL